MGVEDIQIVTCDRGQESLRQPVGTTELPEGWDTVVFGRTEISKTWGRKAVLCPKCLAVALEAARPLERVRRGPPAMPLETPTMASFNEA